MIVDDLRRLHRRVTEARQANALGYVDDLRDEIARLEMRVTTEERDEIVLEIARGIEIEPAPRHRAGREVRERREDYGFDVPSQIGKDSRW